MAGATFAELAGAALPPDPNNLTDSRSMVPYLIGSQTSQRDHVYVEAFKPNFAPDASGNPAEDYEPRLHKQAGRDQAGFKLIYHLELSEHGPIKTQEFYDLTTDPFERTNLILDVGDPPYAEPYAVLRELLTTDYPNLLRDADNDADGVHDFDDNCARKHNPDQRDTDGDLYGNFCDADLDNSCFVNVALMKERYFTADPDADLDGNGTVDFVDLGHLKDQLLDPPGPSASAALCD